MNPQSELFTAAKGYYLTKTLLALWRTGLLERAYVDGLLNVERLAAEEGYSEPLLRAALDYLIVSGYFLSDSEGHYQLSPLGNAARDYYGYLPMEVGGYEPVFSRMEDMLTGTAVYGRDLTRAIREVQTGAVALEGRMVGQFSELSSTLGAKRVLDLGCGEARLLIQVCKKSDHLVGIGIELNRETCEVAERRIEQEGMSDRVRILAGDVTKLEELPTSLLTDIDLVTATFFLHEIYRHQSRSGMVRILRSVMALLGDRGRFAMVEVPKLAAKPVRDGVLFLPEYGLVHDFSDQRLATQEDWESMVQDAGMQVLQVGPAAMCQAFFLLAGPS